MTHRDGWPVMCGCCQLGESAPAFQIRCTKDGESRLRYTEGCEAWIPLDHKEMPKEVCHDT